MSTVHEHWLATAKRAAQRAHEVIEQIRREDLQVETKADLTPVTRADREAERVIRETIAQQYPEHRIWGEEFGRDEIEDDRPMWLIDPIDGTKSFVRDYPFYSTQIAVWHRGELVVGVSSAPHANELAFATAGTAAMVNNTVAKVVDRPLTQAHVSFGNLPTLAADTKRWGNLAPIVQQANRVRGYGDYYHYHLLASGRIDAVIESDLNVLDIAALTVVCRRAGAKVTDLTGQAIGLETASMLAAGPQLHAKLLEMLG